MTKVIVPGVLVLAGLLGAFWWMDDEGVPNNSPPRPTLTKEVVVAMTKDGFMPNKVTIHYGDTVKFVNEDTQDRWPASNIHPTHAIYPEFDPKSSIKPGGTWFFTFTKAGIWRYHDHLLPSLIGTVVAE
ncbi:MAG: hypothetical protein AAB846_02575 [Patescibacteria group bacterium]